MKKEIRKTLAAGLVWMVWFAVWTWLIQTVDVRSAGQTGTRVGFAALNEWFHGWTGVHMQLYHITDWLGLVPAGICMMFGGVGLTQWIRRKSLMKVDLDLLLLGGYYIVVIAGYLVFEMLPVNYRPVLIDGRLEASYPSSTTLLVLSVMPTLAFQAERKNAAAKRTLRTACALFSVLMVVGRMMSGVHWLTDIVGSVLLSRGLFGVYRAAVMWSVQR